MNPTLIGQLPIDVSRDIYRMIPQKRCCVCDQIVVRYPHKDENKLFPWICSIPCLIYYNIVVGKDLFVYNVAIDFCNIVITCNYIFIKAGMVLVAGVVFTGYNVLCVYLMWLITKFFFGWGCRLVMWI